ncbi:MAG: hypothetical protein JOZ58_10880, partial [Acetobacteraceae bacterium]|nr:hypothetical protein [Acetobacteraceae bacterium]
MRISPRIVRFRQGGGWPAGRRALSLAVLLLVAGAPFAPVPAQMESREGIALQNQILELRHQVQLLQDQLARGGGGGPYPLAPPPNTGGSFLGYGGSRAGPSGGAPPSSDLVTQLLDRVSALEDHVRSLRGQVDEISNQTRQQGQDFGKQIGDLSFRMQNLEEGRGAGGHPPPVPPSSPGLPPAAAGG